MHKESRLYNGEVASSDISSDNGIMDVMKFLYEKVVSVDYLIGETSSVYSPAKNILRRVHKTISYSTQSLGLTSFLTYR